MIKLIVALILAVVVQYVLYKVSPLVKNQYGIKGFIAGAVCNVGIWAYMFYLYRINNATSFVSMISPLIIMLVTSILISSSIIDFKYHELPNQHTLVIFLLGICYFIRNIQHWKEFGLGFLLSLGVFIVLSLLLGGNLGFGDVKLATALGIMVPASLFMNFLFLSFLSGAIISIVLMLLKLKNRNDKIAFGPYIGIGFLATHLHLYLVIL